LEQRQAGYIPGLGSLYAGSIPVGDALRQRALSRLRFVVEVPMFHLLLLAFVVAYMIVSVAVAWALQTHGRSK
jgi:hypothetical protein